MFRTKLLIFTLLVATSSSHATNPADVDEAIANANGISANKKQLEKDMEKKRREIVQAREQGNEAKAAAEEKKHKEMADKHIKLSEELLEANRGVESLKQDLAMRGTENASGPAALGKEPSNVADGGASPRRSGADSGASGANGPEEPGAVASSPEPSTPGPASTEITRQTPSSAPTPQESAPNAGNSDGLQPSGNTEVARQPTSAVRPESGNPSPSPSEQVLSPKDAAAQIAQGEPQGGSRGAPSASENSPESAAKAAPESEKGIQNQKFSQKPASNRMPEPAPVDPSKSAAPSNAMEAALNKAKAATEIRDSMAAADADAAAAGTPKMTPAQRQAASKALNSSPTQSKAMVEAADQYARSGGVVDPKTKQLAQIHEPGSVQYNKNLNEFWYSMSTYNHFNFK